MQAFHIFVLDDDYYVHEYFRILSSKLPFNVKISGFKSYETAVQAISGEDYDLYILDNDLGDGRTGPEFYFEYLKGVSSKVIFHSSSYDGFPGELSSMVFKKPIAADKFRLFLT